MAAPLLVLRHAVHGKEQRDDLGVTLRIGDIGIRHLIPPRVGEVIPDMPAAKAGFKAGDLHHGHRRQADQELRRIVDMVGPSAGKQLTFKVDRDGATVDIVEVTRREHAPEGSANGTMMQRGRIGLAPERPEPHPGRSRSRPIRLGVRETYANLGADRLRASGTSSPSASRPIRWAGPS